MTKAEATKSIRLLEANGCREATMIKYVRTWHVFATDRATGARFHADHLDAVIDRIRARALYA